MQIVRTILWVILLFALLAFSFFNWKPVEVTIWSNMVLETKLPALVIIAFLLGLVPMWLIYRASKWRSARRIGALETATGRMAKPAERSDAVVPPPVSTADPATGYPAPHEADRAEPIDPTDPADPRPHRPTDPIDPEPTRPA